MFNALTPDDLLVGIARVLRLVADAPGALEEYERSQALSAYSVSRLLAAEQRATAGLLDDTRRALAAAIGTGEDDHAERIAAAPIAAARIAAARDGTELGAAVAELLAGLSPNDPRRARVHRALAEMADAEVAALADVPS